jgi:hypothetical protein
MSDFKGPNLTHLTHRCEVWCEAENDRIHYTFSHSSHPHTLTPFYKARRKFVNREGLCARVCL